jgi:hypothetical protein
MKTMARRARPPRFVGPSGPAVAHEPTDRISIARRLARAWFDGWQKFASVAGGRAEDLVGGSPWHRS